jgi:hypothetical protein
MLVSFDLLMFVLVITVTRAIWRGFMLRCGVQKGVLIRCKLFFFVTDNLEIIF